MDERTQRSCHPGFMRQAFLWALLPIFALILVAPSVVDAQVTTSITSTTGTGNLGTTITHTGNLYDITGGTRPGNGPNLFHSFGDFSVGGRDIANFLNNIGLPTSNILGRVTGGHVSDIYGTIQTNGTGGFGNANLFLVNPSGIVFGPNGSVNVGGSVSFTTAQYLRLFDGVNSANFYANPANDGLANSVLAVAPVVDFGFLSPAAYGFLTAPDLNATITVQGSALSVPSGQSISLVGGNISVQRGTLDNATTQAATLSAPSGHINVASVASAGEVLYPSLQFGPNVNGGSIALSQGATLDVSGSGNVGSGVVVIRGGQLMIDQSSIIANTVDGNAANPGIDIQVSQDLSLTNGAVISSSTSGTGRGADVAIVAGTVHMDGAAITSATTGSGRGGDLSITESQTVNLTNGTQIVSRTDGPGDGGDITISATGTVSISGFDTTGTLGGVTTTLFDPNTFAPLVTSGVFTTASAAGNGGSISIIAPVIAVDNVGTIATINSGDGRGGDVSLSGGTISFTNGAQLLSSTGFDYSTSLATGTGPGGNVTVTGTDSILLSGVNPDLFAPSQIQSITYGGNGGNITVNVGTLSLTDGAVIWSNNSSLEPAGPDGNVTVGGNVTVQGLQGSGSAADAVTLNNVSIIKAETFNGPGRGGDVSITTHTMQMDIFSEVRTATLFGGGVGGNVFLNLGTLALKGGSVIRTQDFTFGTDLDSDGIVDIPSTGAGGHVTIQAGSADESVVLSGGSKIVSESLDGNGGALSITAPSVNLSEASSISSSTFGFGHGGEIVLNVQQASLSGGATIASAPAFFNPVAGEPGNITIQGLSGNGYMANALTLTGFPTGIIQDTYGTAHAGNIAVLAKTVSLTDAAVIEGGTRFGEGTGGNVTIDAISVSIASGSHISSEARAQASGPVTVTANQLTLNNGSIETTTISELPIGHGGNVELNVGSVSLANGAKIISGTSGVGQGGNITMTVGSLTLANQSEITSSSVGTLADAGNAGNVTITSSGAFTSNASTIATSAENARGGNIDVTAQSVALSNGAVMSASSRSPLLPDGGGNAGNIRITSASNVVMQNSSVTTEASHASGGSIEIDASDAGMVQLVNSQVSTSVKGVAKQSDGGNITIDPQFVVLQNSQVIAQANAGAGGAIDIIATSAFIADPASNVDASSTLGISGTINIQSPVQNVGGQLTPMPQEFSSAAALLAQQCAARVVDGKFSTFVVAGREGLPVEPGGFLASPSLTAELFGSSLSGRAPHTQLSAVTGLFPKYDARPIQLAKFGGACR